MTGSEAIVHCVRIGHCLSSLGHGAGDGKQLPHDGAPPTEQTSRLEDERLENICKQMIGLIFKLTLCVRLRLVYKRLQSFS